AISHVLVSGVEWAVLIPLIVGGSPGTFLGARMANWVSQSVIRRGIVIVLSLTGLNMLGVPPKTVGIIGAALLLLGPLAWGFIRQTRGLPAFDNNAAAWNHEKPSSGPDQSSGPVEPGEPVTRDA
ncbi:MAG: sulfite exporter TauE/SafE family protein, partial [Nocardioidaceae bacterium]